MSETLEKLQKLKQAKVGEKSLELDFGAVGGPLGYILWYTVGELDVSVKVFQKKAAAHHIPEEILPKVCRPYDAFRTATKEVGEFHGFLVEDDKTEVEGKVVKNPRCRLLVSKTRDENNLPIIGKWTFSVDEDEKASMEKEFLSSDTAARRQWDEISLEVAERFKHLKNIFVARDIRYMLQLAIKKMMSYSLRPSGSVYFCPYDQKTLLENLSELIGELGHEFSKSTYSTELITLPVQDTAKSKKTLYEQFEKDAMRTIEELMPRITEILNDPRKLITPSQFVIFLNGKKYIEDCKKKYEGLFSYKMETTETQLEILSKSLEMLTDRIKERE